MKFLIVEDHPLVREGLRYTLEAFERGVTVLEASTAQEAGALVKAHADLALVLLDLGLPDSDGFAAFEMLRRQNGQVPIIVLSASDAPPNVVSALNQGAAGFVSKTQSREVILQAVRLVLAGSIYVPPHILAAGRKDNGSREASPGASPPALTARQLEVLALLAMGKPNKTIARELNISEATVKAHLTEIFRVLKVTNRAQAALAARSIVRK